MARLLLLALAGSLLLAVQPVVAETPPDNEAAAEPKAMVEAFLAAVQAGDVEGAYNQLLVGSLIPEQGTQYQLLKSQTNAQLAVFGNPLDVEFLEDCEVGTSIINLKYLARYEKDALVWSFVFYKPKGTWIVTAVRFMSSMQYL